MMCGEGSSRPGVDQLRSCTSIISCEEQTLQSCKGLGTGAEVETRRLSSPNVSSFRWYAPGLVTQCGEASKCAVVIDVVGNGVHQPRVA